jgi:hypothetical protein
MRGPPARRQRVRLAELGDVGGLVGLARDAAEDDDADPVGARPELALGLRADPDDVVGVEREALPLDLDLAAAADHQEDLLLVVVRVVVFGVVLVVGRHVDDLHAEGLHSEFGAGALEGAAVDRLHLVDVLDREAAHLSPPVDPASVGLAS